MDRRLFFKTIGQEKGNETGKQERRISSGLTPYAGAWTKNEVVHFLKRTNFGAPVAQVNTLLGLNLNSAVNLALTSPAAPAPPVNTYATPSDLDGVAFNATWVNTADNPQHRTERTYSLKSWWFGLMVNQGLSITEKMTLFWHNHFATEDDEVPFPSGLYRINALFRQNALGNFKTLTKLVSKEPAMLYYLNGYKNTNTAPDENYARELMELFTLGKDPAVLYTEDDVKAAAKVLTGYRLDNYSTTFAYNFNATKHDNSTKTFSAYFNNTTIAGAGEAELDQLLDMIFAKDEVALFICRKLYRFFVYYVIDADTETNLIAPLAAIFRQNNYEIAPVLDALFKSEHFFDPGNRSCVIKSPVDFVAGLSREMQVAYPTNNAANIAKLYACWKQNVDGLTVTGQLIGDPPNVSGWPAYYQAPGFHELWINSNTYPRRAYLSTTLLSQNGFNVMGFALQSDLVTFTQSLPNPADPNALIDDALQILVTFPASVTLKSYLKTILLNGQTQDYYWSDIWSDYAADPTDPIKKQLVLVRLRNFYTYIVNLPDFQLS